MNDPPKSASVEIGQLFGRLPSAHTELVIRGSLSGQEARGRASASVMAADTTFSAIGERFSRRNSD